MIVEQYDGYISRLIKLKNQIFSMKLSHDVIFIEDIELNESAKIVYAITSASNHFNA